MENVTINKEAAMAAYKKAIITHNNAVDEIISMNGDHPGAFRTLIELYEAQGKREGMRETLIACGILTREEARDFEADVLDADEDSVAKEKTE